MTTTPPLDHAEPLAVIGMACRAPGARSIDEFWSLLRDGVDAVYGDHAARFQDRDPATAGPLVRAGLLTDISDFDAGFFGISPREARSMDPQQRLLLETTWEALEDAGIVPGTLAGSRTGVYVGASSSQYWEELVSVGQADIYGVSGGGARSTVSGRISYTFDLRGPSMNLDTACSSSLVAVAAAGSALRSGECDLAVVGGAQLLLGPAESEAFTAAGMLSPDGACKFGDETANGFVRGEAVGTVVLKRLADAVRDGDPIRATIRGWGVSSDGAASGSLMAPSVEGQRQMLRDAYTGTGIDPASVAYVEAHGTGTPVGDPVELGALAAELTVGRDRDLPLVVGSVKTNIGHTEPASGLMGLIKTVLCLEHALAPRSLHLTRPTSRMNWDAPITISQVERPLEAVGDAPLAAGVSAFGISGTNAHVVLSAADQTTAPERDAATAETGDTHLLTLSAHTPDALLDRMRTYLAYLGTGASRGHEVADICATAGLRRTHHAYRATAVGHDHESIADNLRQVLHGTNTHARAGTPRVVFVFPGQGSQWRGMGRDLLGSSPAFRAALHRCDAAVQAETGWSVIDVLEDDGDAALARAEVVQPVLWAMQVALAQTWRAWGIEPDAVIGHSMGECAAAYIAGALTLEEAASVICRRARLATERAGGQGGMALVELDSAAAAAALEPYGGALSVAAANGPTTSIVAGELESLGTFVTAMEQADVLARQVRVDYASHCAQMDPLLADLRTFLDHLRPVAGTVPIYSTVTAETTDGSIMDADYWARNLREQVRFRDAVHQITDAGDAVFVEISPHPVLVQSVRSSAGERREHVLAVPSTRRDLPERESLLESLGALYTAGARIDFAGLYAGHRTVPLPGHPWQRSRFWIETTDGPAGPAGRGAADEPEMLLDPGRERYLLEHRVREMSLVAGPVFLEAARSAAAEALGGPVELNDVDFTETLLMSPGTPVTLNVSLLPVGPADQVGFEVQSRVSDGPRTTHATGTARRPDGSATASVEPLQAAASRCLEHSSGDAFYARARAGGIDWGETFLAVDDVWRGDGEVIARLHRPESLGEGGGRLHPAVIEAAAATILAALPDPGAMLAHHIGTSVVTAEPVPGDLWAHATVSGTPDGELIARVELVDAAGRLVVLLDDMRIRLLRPAAAQPAPAEPESRSTTDLSLPGSSPEGQPMNATVPDLSTATGPSDVTLTGELHLQDPRSGLVLDLRGQLRVDITSLAGPSTAGSAPTTTAFTAPAFTAPAFRAPAFTAPATIPAPVLPPAPVQAPVPVPTPAPAPVPAPAPTPAPATHATTAPQASAAPAAPSVPTSPGQTQDRLARVIGGVLGMNPRQIDPASSLQSLGLDSLMALEIKKKIQDDLGVQVPTTRLLGDATLSALATTLDGDAG